MNLEENWNEFVHKIVEGPTASARINEQGLLEVEVYLKMKHWNESKGFLIKLAQPIKHGIGFTIPLEKLWTIAEGCVTPLRHCNGRFPCGEINGE